MANMATPIYDPFRDDLYQLFYTYFNDPVMTKMKDVHNYSQYQVKIQAVLGTEQRYIIVFVHKDGFAKGTREKLSNLPWISLQTRTLKEDHNILNHTYIPRRLPRLDKVITLSQKDSARYEYNVKDLPITITLLPSGAKRTNEYNPSGTVVSALETYNTIVQLK